MKNKLTHFAIHIDDVDRAKDFYGGVFEWGFSSYGPTDFLQIKADQSENGELIGALQSRHYSPVKEKLIGLECTISVENVEEIIRRVESKGGEILMPKTAIPYVGWITKFLDTEGNLICAMQYDHAAR
ncbi:VOC family protein [Emticicia sp. CRIBPO]|uniref:VOC family protein n=1 Tax=Emticicia sp. CRIBPO TaxID=2683258 RepID=UPI0014129A5D|nr:VOC family protein [Emticicia sp. CRIBPO]NBA86671.1 VOC family protein [Emticicia sp. CRIBPO]